MVIDKDYILFQQFIDKYIQQGFQNINRDDPFMVEMESILRARKQFFYIGDLIHIRVIFTSQGSEDMIGIDPATLEPGSLYKATHPSDLHRMNLARLRLSKQERNCLNKKTARFFIPFHFTLLEKTVNRYMYCSRDTFSIQKFPTRPYLCSFYIQIFPSCKFPNMYITTTLEMMLRYFVFPTNPC